MKEARLGRWNNIGVVWSLRRKCNVEMKEARLGRWNNSGCDDVVMIFGVEMKEARLGRWNFFMIFINKIFATK